VLRAAARLVRGYTSGLGLGPEAVLAAGELAGRLRDGRVLAPVEGWGGHASLRAALAGQADAQAARALEAAGALVAAKALFNVKEHERAVTGAYRMTGRALPGSASESCAQILAPLRDVSGPWRGKVDLAPLCKAVLGPTCAAFKEAFEAVVKREESLLRLQRRAARDEPSDSEKICAQMRLDAEFLRNECLQFGASAEDTDCLLAAV
jgi:hypothetical protein